MKLLKPILAVFLGFIFVFSIIACSKDKSPVEPVIDDAFENIQEIPVSFNEVDSNRSMLAAYNCVIDPVAKTFTCEPANRSAEYHFPLTNLYPNVLQITGINWTPDFWVDIKLSHPLPGSGIIAFDPRVIAILPAYPGVSMDYPIFNVHANNTIVLEPDGYTKLFDSVNPSIVGNTNPFIAYFKEEPLRMWRSLGATEETKRWYMNVTGIGGPFVFDLVVDVSTNYPDPIQIIEDNAPEPVDMDVLIGPPLMPNGGDTIIEVTFLDWQDVLDIKCKIESPDLFTGAIQLNYTGPGTDFHKFVFSGSIPNELHAPAGTYPVLVAAWDIPNDTHIFKEVYANVVDELFFDPVELITFDTSGSTYDVDVVGSYAYIADWSGGFKIIDVDPPEDANLVKMLDTPGYPTAVHVSGGYAYVAAQHSGLHIIDVNYHVATRIVKTVSELDNLIEDVYVSDGYAYVADGEAGLTIIDVDPYQDAFIVKSVYLGDYDPAQDVFLKGGFAYVASFSGLHIIDIEPQENAYVVKTVETPELAVALSVMDGYAFVADAELWGDPGLLVVDVDPPEDASIVKSLLLPGSPYDVFIAGGYAYVPAASTIQIIDVTPAETAYIVYEIDLVGISIAESIDVIGDLAYVADGRSMGGGLRIFDLW